MELDSFVGKDTHSDGSHRAGVFNYFDTVFKDSDYISYKAKMKEVYGGNKDLDVQENIKKYFENTYRRNQMSDHLPVWGEIVIDSSEEFLRSKRAAL